LFKIDPHHWFWSRSGVPRRALLPLAGLFAAAKSLLLASILLAALLPSAGAALARDAGSPHSVEAWPRSEPASALPKLALEPMSDRSFPGQAIHPDTAAPILWSQPQSLPALKLRPLPDAELLLFEPAGCQAPPSDYSPVRAGPRMLSARTLAMLAYAAQLYGGRLDITGEAVLPSPRSAAEQENPDPGGEYGVVDLAVVERADGRVLYEEIDPLIRALRAAGFAAWLRDRAELNPKSEAYVHAVAIGDRQLSDEALAQLSGPDGYFHGGRGLGGNVLVPDPHGGPVLCRWMYQPAAADLRAGPALAGPAVTEPRWEMRLQAVAESFITSDPEATAELARQLGYLSSGQEDPSNMCGPLSAAILREAGLLPASVGPVANLKSYWLANPVTNGRPWSLFPADQYQVYRFQTGTDRFDFADWPLLPGDFVYTYAGRGSFSHMFVVTEVDTSGRAYTVTNQLQPDGGYLVQRVLLYDPQEHEAGVLHSPCLECGSWRRRTGLGGFDVLRRRDLGQPSGTEVVHTVLPGETLPRIAGAYGSTLAALAERNEFNNPLALQVGEQLLISVNLPLAGPEDPAPSASINDAASLAPTQLTRPSH
jgi:hypothetical protein